MYDPLIDTRRGCIVPKQAEVLAHGHEIREGESLSLEGRDTVCTGAYEKYELMSVGHAYRRDSVSRCVASYLLQRIAQWLGSRTVSNALDAMNARGRSCGKIEICSFALRLQDEQRRR